MRKFASLIILILTVQLSFAQSDSAEEERTPIQFSGLVMSSDSLMALPFTYIYTPNRSVGTVADLKGFFTFAAYPGDTLIFSAIGYKKSSYVIPDTLDTDKYSMIKLLTSDTFELDPTIIQPIPRALIDRYILTLDVPDDDLERARKNLEREQMKEEMNAMPMDGTENQRYYQQKTAQSFYYQGQVPPMNIFNPIAWAQFFEAWKRGDFKKQD